MAIINNSCYIKYNLDNIYIYIPYVYDKLKDIKKYNEEYLSKKLISICNKNNISTLEIESNEDVKDFSNFHDKNVKISWKVTTNEKILEKIKQHWVDNATKDFM